MDHYPLLADLTEAAAPTELPGTYVGVRFSADTVNELVKIQEDLEIPNPLDSSDFHTTVMYSKHIPNFEPAGELEDITDGEDFQIEIWKSGSGKKNIAVLTYNSDYLTERHEELMDVHSEHATWDHDDFSPHITLSYDVGDWKPSDLSLIHI